MWLPEDRDMSMNRLISDIKVSFLLAAGLALVLCLTVGVLPARADEPRLEEAPKPPPPVEPPPVIDGHGTGFVPPNRDLSHLTGQKMPGRFMFQDPPPSSFDWRASGKVTSVQDNTGGMKITKCYQNPAFVQIGGDTCDCN